MGIGGWWARMRRSRRCWWWGMIAVRGARCRLGCRVIAFGEERSIVVGGGVGVVGGDGDWRRGRSRRCAGLGGPL